MELKLTVPNDDNASTIEVSELVFGQEFNETLVHQVVVAYLTKARAGTHKQKTRAEVRGGGRKPWRQKGTGRARAGTTRSPLWRKGGVIFAKVPKDYSKSVKVNKKSFGVAMRAIFSELVRQENRLIVVPSLSVTEAKTKPFIQQLDALGFKKGLIITDELDENLYLSARNIPNIELFDAVESASSPVDLVAAEQVLITVGALKQIEERLG